MNFIWKDGVFMEAQAPAISAGDGGFLNGLGVFDSMLWQNGTGVYAPAHYERLCHDAHVVLNKNLPVSFECWIDTVSQLVRKNDGEDYARIRTLVTAGILDGPLRPAAGPPCVVIYAQKGTPPPAPAPVTAAVIADFPRIARCALENCKRVDYTRSFAARNRANAMGAEEAILLNTDGNVACAATSNIFMREGGKWLTPPLTDGVLAGITRRRILERGEAVEDTISPARLHAADKIYISNSFFEKRPVRLLR